MNAIETARAELVAALEANHASAPWRVHPHRPPNVIAPCVFVGPATLGTVRVGSPGAVLVQTTFPIYLVVDGSNTAQAVALDEQLAAVWDAATAVGDPTDARPTFIDVGGPTLAATVVSVDMPIRALTLCPPTLEAASG